MFGLLLSLIVMLESELKLGRGGLSYDELPQKNKRNDVNKNLFHMPPRSTINGESV